jgi:hypothetical protein
MGDAVSQTLWDFSLWARVAGATPALFPCIFATLAYTDLACAEDRALQGWNSSAAASPEWLAAPKPPHIYHASPSKDARFFVQPIGSTVKDTQYVLGTLDQEHTQVTITGFGNSQLWISFAGLLLSRSQSQVAAHLAAASKSFFVTDRQHESESRQRAHTRYLLQDSCFWILGIGQLFHLPVRCSNLLG